MIKRRKFLKIGGVSAALLAMGSNPLNATAKKKKKAKKKAKKKVARKRVSQLYLREVTGDEAAPSSSGLGAVVGWGVPVITDFRQLIAMAHLENAEPVTSYDVAFIINGESFEEDTGVIDTNVEGDGNTLMVIELTDYPRSIGTMNVQIELQGDNGDVLRSATVPISSPTRKKKKKKKST